MGKLGTSRSDLVFGGAVYIAPAALIAAAWIGNVQPALAGVAMGLATGVVVLQGALFLWLGRRRKASQEAALMRRADVETENALAVEPLTSIHSHVSHATTEKVMREVVELHLEHELMQAQLYHRLSVHSQLRSLERISSRNTSTLVFAFQNLAKEIYDVEIRSQSRLSGARKVLQDWTLAIDGAGSDAFTVDAGPLKIQHFNGEFNIQVVDPSKVTVEGVDRDPTRYPEPNAFSAPPGVRGTVYN